MNVYQKILVKLYEVSGGKDSNVVDIKELVKSEGFLPSYKDIYKQMSQQGWIAETGRDDLVKITHWGVKEAKKVQTGVTDNSREIQRTVNRLKAEVKEFLVITEEFANDISAEHYQLVEKKSNEIKAALDALKANF
jgi:hypothetical protein